MANPYPFVAGNVLTAAQMNGIGEWTSYTPVLTATTTNPTLGIGSSSVGNYARVQDYIVYRFSVSFGTSGTNAGSGNYKISLPVTANQFGAYFTQVAGQTCFFDLSTGLFYFMNAWLESTTNLTLLYQNGANGTALNVSSTAPVVPTVGDTMSGLVIYRAA